MMMSAPRVDPAFADYTFGAADVRLLNAAMPQPVEPPVEFPDWLANPLSYVEAVAARGDNGVFVPRDVTMPVVSGF